MVLYSFNQRINEYSCIISFPNTEEQDYHRDGIRTIYRELLVLGIYLSDITKEMGPTEILEGSNKINLANLEYIINKNKKKKNQQQEIKEIWQYGKVIQFIEVVQMYQII